MLYKWDRWCLRYITTARHTILMPEAYHILNDDGVQALNTRLKVRESELRATSAPHLCRMKQTQPEAYQSHAGTTILQILYDNLGTSLRDYQKWSIHSDKEIPGLRSHGCLPNPSHPMPVKSTFSHNNIRQLDALHCYSAHAGHRSQLLPVTSYAITRSHGRQRDPSQLTPTPTLLCINQSMPCSRFNFSRFSCRSAKFSLDCAIFSGW